MMTTMEQKLSVDLVSSSCLYYQQHMQILGVTPRLIPSGLKTSDEPHSLHGPDPLNRSLRTQILDWTTAGLLESSAILRKPDKLYS